MRSKYLTFEILNVVLGTNTRGFGHAATVTCMRLAWPFKTQRLIHVRPEAYRGIQFYLNSVLCVSYNCQQIQQ
jgi:hypothetical protein